jgi:hypothetical protein
MPPTRLWADNQSSITVTRNPEHHQRNKHWDISYHWIREQHKMQTLDIAYISINNMTADAMTKSLPKVKHEKHVAAMGLQDFGE